MLRSKWKLEEGWTSFALLAFMLLCVVWSVQAAEWTDGLVILQWVALAAIVFGLFLTRSRRMPAVLAHLLALLVGASCVTLMLSVIFAAPMVPLALAPMGQSLTERVSVMAQQVMLWFANPAQADAWLSNWMFVLALAALTWLLCYLSTWFVLRRHWVWGAVLPAGVACLLNIYYAPSALVVYLGLFCLSALLLVVRMHVYLRQKEWREASVNYSLDVDLTFIRDGALISVLAIAMAWTIPTIAANRRLAELWTHFQDPWHDVQTYWSRAFTSLNYQGPSGRVNFSTTFTLGGAVNLGSTPVLDVQSPEPHYWRAVTYDRYTGSGWLNTDKGDIALKSLEQIPGVGLYAMQQMLTYTVRLLEPGEDLLFVAGEPVVCDIPARVRSRVLSLPGGLLVTEVSSLRAQRPMRRAAAYQVTCLVSAAGAAQLRTAGTDYPASLTPYLELPADLPERVRRLSSEVAGDARTPYEQAEAIQEYLRRMTYDQYITSPPAGHDVVDWFLFEARRGYCDYYATAMAVMCRCLGIPTRVAQGYTPGEYVPASRSYRVQQLNAHAWVEVYFPGYGWIEFEPTAGQPLLSRPEDTVLPLLSGQIDQTNSQRRQQEDKFGPDENLIEEVQITASRARGQPWYKRWAVPVLAGLSSILLLLLGWWNWNLRGLNPAARVYAEMCRLGSLLGVPAPLYETPAEYGKTLALTVHEEPQSVRRLVDLYVKQEFSLEGLEEPERAEVRARWRKLRWQMCRQALRPRWRKHTVSSVYWVPPSSMHPTNSLES